jgi:DNA-binding LacI/PurR family transcriptional regulator
MIGVAIGNLRNQIYPVMLEKLADGLSAQGYRILLFTAPLDGEADPEMGQIMRYQPDAVVLAATSISSALALECRAAGVPVVLFNRMARGIAGREISSVTGANYEGGREIGRLVAASGHRRPAFIAGHDLASTSLDREAGYAEGLAEAGLPPALRVRGNFQEADTRNATAELLSRPDRPDAVFAASDQMALVAMDMARHRFGLRVPQDLSIIGFDDAPAASWPSYDLTSYAQPAAAMVAATIELLLERIADPTVAPRLIVVPGQLVLRGSARLPPVMTRDGDQP